jgi:hypothetical protein
VTNVRRVGYQPLEVRLCSGSVGLFQSANRLAGTIRLKSLENAARIDLMRRRLWGL